jgi:hypothetical protein
MTWQRLRDNAMQRVVKWRSTAKLPQHCRPQLNILHQKATALTSENS